MNRRWAMIKAVVSRDWIAVSRSPIVWIATAGFSAIVGLIFSLIVNSTHQSDAISIMVATVGIILMILIPLLASKPILDDRQCGLEEVIFSSPIAAIDWVISRWLSGLVVLGLLLGATIGIVFAVAILGHADLGKIASAYFGWSIMGMAFCAVGVWAAMVGRGVISSGLISLGTLMILWLLAPLSVLESGRVAEILRETSLVHHTYGFEQGIISGPDYMYFLILTVVFIGMAVVMVQSRRLE